MEGREVGVRCGKDLKEKLPRDGRCKNRDESKWGYLKIQFFFGGGGYRLQKHVPMEIQ